MVKQIFHEPWGVRGGEGKRVEETREGERETHVDFIFGHGHMRKLLYRKLRILERLVDYPSVW